MNKRKRPTAKATRPGPKAPAPCARSSLFDFGFFDFFVVAAHPAGVFCNAAANASAAHSHVSVASTEAGSSKVKLESVFVFRNRAKILYFNQK